MAKYPSTPPFPHSAVASIGVAAGSPRTEGVDNARTCVLPIYSSATTTLESYLRHYRGVKVGAALGIMGDYGSGKTHLIGYLMSLAANHPDAVLAYVKINTSDFMALYRALISNIGVKQLTLAHFKTLSVAAKKRATDNAGPKSENILQPTLAVLDQDPAAIMGYLRNAILPEAAVVADTLAALDTNSRRSGDFFSAFTYFNDVALKDAAFSWLLGDELSDETLKRLGVNGTLKQEDAVQALRFLAGMFAFAEMPMLVYFDQIERLVVDVNRQALEANRGRLHALIEALLANRAFFCIAGVSTAWRNLPPDFIERLGAPPIVMPSLGIEETKALIAVYLGSKGKRRKTSEKDSIYPFEADSIAEIVARSRGNIRATLGLCYKAFEIASPQKLTIDAEIVKKAAVFLDRPISPSSVRDQAALLVQEAGLSCVRDVELKSGIHSDIAIPDSSKPSAVIDVLEPIFLEDEVRDASRYAEAVTEIHTEHPAIQFVLIDAGYRSPQVQKILRPLATHYLRYDPDTFLAEFKKIIASLQQPQAPSASTDSTAAAAPDADALLNQLRSLLTERTSQRSEIDERLTAFLGTLSGSAKSSSKADESRARSPWLALQDAWKWIAAVGAVTILGAGIMAGLQLYERLEQRDREAQYLRDNRDRVAQSLRIIDAGRSGDIQDAKDKIFDFLSRNAGDMRDALALRPKDSLLSLLLTLPTTAPSARRLMSYYNSAYTCLRNSVCDERSLCEGLVREIREFDRIVEPGGLKPREIALPTDADRLIDACK